MKKLSIILILFTILEINFGQVVKHSITVTDNDGGTTQLYFGLDPTATDGMNNGLGENALPPLPPAGIFDARFKLPGTTDASLQDYRLGDANSFVTSIFEVQYQVGTGTSVTISWNLPLGITGTIEDKLGGVVYKKDMNGNGNLTVTNPDVINKLKMTIVYKLGAPDVPNLVAPPTNLIDVSLTPTLVWNQAKNRETFHLQVSKDANFTNLVFNDSTLTDTTKTISNLDVLTKYYWRVRAKSTVTGTTHSAFSNAWNFTTTNLPPLTPNLLAPINNATEVLLNTTLSWHKAKYAANYILQVSKESNFNSFVVNDSTLTDTLKALANLTPITKYYWRVKAKNSVGKSNFSSEWNFTSELIPPAAPDLTTPLDQAVDQELNPNFVWAASLYADKYQLIVSLDQNFTQIVFNDSTITSTSKIASGLLPLTKYYWKVAAKNTKGKSPFSSVREFTTKNVPPPAPVLLTPQNNGTDQLLDLTFTWQKTAYAASYELQIATDNTFSNVIVTVGDYTFLSKFISGFEYDKQYFWRVRAKNGAGFGEYSQVWNFSTVVLSWKLLVTAASAGNATNQKLVLGTSINGSDELDPALNEILIPPAPPQEIFDVRFLLPSAVPQFSIFDIRKEGANSYNWLVRLQTGSSGYPITLSWDPANLPLGTFSIKDTITGQIINSDMKAKNSVTISDSRITSVVINYTKQICVPLSLKKGWNIISIPVLAQSMIGTNIIPFAQSPFWGFNNGYYQISTLVNGIGYWIKVPKDSTFNLCGFKVTQSYIDVKKGWNLIGLFENNVIVSQITSDPANIIISPFWGFNNGYIQATTLEKGKGYWVKVSADGKIYFNAAMGKNLNDALISDIKNEWTKIIVTDKNNNSKTVYISNEAVNTQLYELPPAPPDGGLDVRFEDRTFVIKKGIESVLEISSDSYPIKISVDGAAIKLKDQVTGQFINQVLKKNETLVISNPSIDRLAILCEELPINYELYQNYPNPFNPTTTIRYAVPEAVHVSIIIFDALGREISRLVDKNQDAGVHTIQLNTAELGLSSGIYFYELRAGNFVKSKKLLLLK